jgi:hypothetical protein
VALTVPDVVRAGVVGQKIGGVNSGVVLYVEERLPVMVIVVVSVLGRIDQTVPGSPGLRVIQETELVTVLEEV